MKYILFICLLAAFSLASFRTITGFNVQGKVTDDKGSPLAGVTVREKGSTTGASSDGNGEFRITVSSGKAVLVFSMVGYDNKQVSVKEKSIVNVTLKASTQKLEEVVVVGYGIADYESAPRKPNKIVAPPLSYPRAENFAQALEGRSRCTNWHGLRQKYKGSKKKEGILW